MAPQSVTRKLAAIFHADVQGYSRLIGEDEVTTLRTVAAHLDLMRTLVRQHGGRAIGSRGDSLLAEFPSVVEAVQSAVEMQQELKGRNAALPGERRVEFRIGINLGEVVVEGNEIYGDGVNVTVRLESIAEAGGICISEMVYDQVRNRLALHYEDLGEQTLKNIERPIRAWRVVMDEAPASVSEVVLRHAQHERTSTPVTLSLSKGDRQRKLSTAHLTQTMLILVGLLLLGGIATLLYPALSPLSPQDSARRTQSPPALPLPDKPSIVVLPFVNMSGDPEQEYFSDGMTEDLITELAKNSGLFVIARNSAFVYKGKAVDVKEVSRGLGVRYILEGSVRKAGDRVRITAQLLDGASASHLWAESYDRELKDIFAVQDEVKQQVITALWGKLPEAEFARVRRTPTANLTAYDYLWRGWEHYNRLTREAHVQARQMFEKAIELDPKLAGAYLGLGWSYWLGWIWQWSQDPRTLERALEMAQTATALDDSLAHAYTLLGQVYLWKGRQYEQAIAAGERAIALDPNCAGCYGDLGMILSFAGRPEEAIGLAEKAMRLDPYFADFYAITLGIAYALMEQYEKAVAPLKRVLTRNPDHISAHIILAIAYSGLGREEEARAEVKEALRIDPHYSLETLKQRTPNKNRALMERYLEALRKAGLK